MMLCCSVLECITEIHSFPFLVHLACMKCNNDLRPQAPLTELNVLRFGAVGDPQALAKLPSQIHQGTRLAHPTNHILAVLLNCTPMWQVQCTRHVISLDLTKPHPGWNFPNFHWQHSNSCFLVCIGIYTHAQIVPFSVHSKCLRNWEIQNHFCISAYVSVTTLIYKEIIRASFTGICMYKC